MIRGLAFWVTLLPFLWFSCVGFSADGGPRPDGWRVAEEVELPWTEVRAFGGNEGEYVRYEAAEGTGSASWLRMVMESEEKARLLHAKYVHDLKLGGGIAREAEIAGSAIKYYEIAEQGCVVAAHYARSVAFLTADTPETLKTLAGAAGMENSAWRFAADMEVPLYIRGWNDFPFRFYYWFDQHPRDVSSRDYKRLPEFDWAKAQGTGFINWVNVATNDTAEGLSFNNGIHWAIRAAARRGLPTVINTSLTNNQVPVMNYFAHETQMGMPDFIGSFYCVADPGHAGIRELSWGSQKGKDAQLAALQTVVRETRDMPGVIEFLEPHGEVHHGNHDIYLEYGPVADRSFQEYLRQEYQDNLAEISRRWYGDADYLKSWDEVRVPEIAGFAGWNADALDLKGDWRIRYEPEKGKPPVPREAEAGEDEGRVRNENQIARNEWERAIRAPEEWFAADFDDADWPTIPVPGHDRIMFVHRRNPAVFRRTFTVPEEWRQKNERVWIYVWDLNREHSQTQQVWVNGKLAGEQSVPHPRNNVMVFEVSDILKAGENSVALRLSEGFLSYKVYLSSHEPAWYPKLSPTENCRWVDFVGWWRWSRIEAVRRGLEMIREVEPDKGIVCMSPYSYFAGIRELCVKYGGRFHDTGGMSGSLSYDLPGMMRGAGLPSSLEPGGPAGDAAELRRFTSLWAIEGINAIHYYIHIGSVFWDAEMKKLFEELKPQIQFMGKYHVPRGEVASLMDDRQTNLTDFPLIGKGQYNTFIRHEPGLWSLARYFTQEYYWDNITLYDFEDLRQENLRRYRTVIDTNCSILSEKQVKDIERWVRDGGVFVTHVQTGRHLPETADAWPISALTGYRVTYIDPHDERGEASWRGLEVAENQSVIRPENWPKEWRRGNGLSLEKTAPECVDLLYWEDGSVAAGIRPLGKGYVIHLGAKFSNNVVWWGDARSLKTVMNEILEWRDTPTHPARAENVLMQPAVTNDGLFDVWTTVNIRREPCETRIVFPKGRVAPAELTEIGTGKRWALRAQEDGSFATDTILYVAEETRIFTAPRKKLDAAALEWAKLQRSWWQGAWKPASDAERLAPPMQEHTLAVNHDWALRDLADEEKPEDFAAVNYNDSAWQRGTLESWIVPEDSPASRRVFRREFRIPEHWKGGEALMMFQGSYDSPFMGRGDSRLWLDGVELKRYHRGVSLEDWKPGRTYQVTIYCEGWTDVNGPSGNFWIAWVPKPVKTLSLAGEWTPSNDALHWYETPIALPGAWPEKANFAKRKFEMPAFDAEKTQVFVRFETARSGLTGVIINGHYIRRSHHDLSETTFLNITPWLKPGAVNEMEIVGRGGENQEVKEIRLDFYER